MAILLYQSSSFQTTLYQLHSFPQNKVIMMHPNTPQVHHHRHNHSNPSLLRDPSPQAPPRPHNYHHRPSQQRNNGLADTKHPRSSPFAPRDKSPIKTSPHHLPPQNTSEDYVSKLMQKAKSLDRMKMSHAKASRKQENVNPTWRKHEPIQNLLDRESRQLSRDRHVECGNKPTSYDQCLLEMEQKYKQLQNKYKTLMVEASTQAKEYEEDKQQLQDLRKKTKQNSSLLSQLKSELLSLNQATKKSKFQEDLKSQDYLQTDISTIHSIATPSQIQNMWKKHDEDDRKIKTETSIPRPNQTSTSWHRKHQMEESTSNISQQQLPRYYSASKVSKASSNTLQATKSVKNLMAASRVSKSGCKDNASLKGSKTRYDTKMLDLTSKNEMEGLRMSTRNTLQKRKAGSGNNKGGYEKYRFEPTFRMA